MPEQPAWLADEPLPDPEDVARDIDAWLAALPPDERFAAEYGRPAAAAELARFAPASTEAAAHLQVVAVQTAVVRALHRRTTGPARSEPLAAPGDAHYVAFQQKEGSMMRLRSSLPAAPAGSGDQDHPRFIADVPAESDVPAYVWPLNPWGGYPFRRASA